MTLRPELEELKKKQSELVEEWIAFHKTIIESCPKLYKHFNYFEVGAGWYCLLEKLSKNLEELIPKDNESMYAVQVKEKFGTLRFYLTSETDEMRALIEKAEELSASTCETCGDEGETRTDHGWIKTRCDKCYKEGFLMGLYGS